MAPSFGFSSLASGNDVNGQNLANTGAFRPTQGSSGRWAIIRRTSSGASNPISLTGFPTVATVTDGNTGRSKVRFRFRMPTVYPNVIRNLWSWNCGGSNFQHLGVIVNTDGTVACFSSFSGAIVQGTPSSAVPLGNGWVTVEFDGRIVLSGTSDQLISTAVVTFANGTVENLSYTSAVSNLAATALMSSPILGGLPGGASGFTSSWIGHLEFCDYALLMASNADVAGMGSLPGDKTTKMAQLRIVGDGSLTGIAYSSAAAGWYSMNKATLGGTITDNRVTTTTNAQQRDWNHTGVARLGASNVLALKLNQIAAGTGAGVSRFLVGGASVASSEADALPTVTATENVHYSRAGWTQSAFDAMALGVESVVTGGTYNCVALHIEVMHDGTLEYPTDEMSLGDGYRQEWLTWTGDGTNFRTLSGLSFKPHAAWVFSPGEGSSPKILVDVLGDNCVQANGTNAVDSFYGFTADGMYVGVGGTPASGLNQNAQAYYGFFIRDDGSPIYDVSGSTPEVTGYEFLFASGGISPQQPSQAIDFGSLMANGFQPAMLAYHPAPNTSSAQAGFKRTAMGATNTYSLNGSGSGYITTTAITTLDANGFTTLGGNTMLSNGNRLAPFIAWSDHADLVELVRFGELGSFVQNTGYTLYHPVRVSFEDETTVTRPSLADSDHQLFGPTVSAGSLTGFTVNSGESLLVSATTYNLGGGTRTLTWDGVPMTKVHGNFGAAMGMEFWFALAPNPGTGTIAWSSTATASRLNLAAIAVANCGGIRTINGREGSLVVEVLTRPKDLIHGVFVSDALDSGSSYTVPGDCTELWNDGTVGAAGVGFNKNGSGSSSSVTITEAGGSDVTYFSLVSLMPVSPVWNPYLVLAKDNRVSAPSSGYRLDAGVHVGTDNSTYYSAQGSLMDGTAVLELENNYFGLNAQAAAGTLGGSDVLRQNGNYWMAFAGPGVIVALSPPTGINDAYDCDFNTLLTVDEPGVLSNDLANGGGTLSVDSVVDDVTHGVLTLYPDGSFTYMPDTDYVGIDTFTYLPTTTEGGVGTLATVTITVLADVTTPIIDFRNRGPLAWIEWKDSNDQTYRWADRPIGNAPEPNENRKERQILKWGDITAALSNDDGHPSGNSFDCEVQDIDRQLRMIMATESTRYLWGQPLDVWCTTIAARAAGLPPARIFRGRMQQPHRVPNRRAKMRAEDIISTMSDPAIMARDIPRRRLQFQLSDTKQFNNAEPIIYGDVNSTGLPHAGVIQPIYLMDHTIGASLYRLFMVAGHACKAMTIYYKGDLIPDSCYSDGLIFAPGKPGWPYGTYDPIIDVTVGPVGTTYIEHAGRRYTVIAVRADQINPDDVDFLGVDVQGIETVGDGSGTLITNYFDAYYHFLVNFGLQSWLTGDWLDPPLWPDGGEVIDDYYWDAAQAVTASRMGSGPGYQVRAVIGANGQAATLQDWLRRWNVSGDCRMTIWDGQLQVHVPDRLVTITESIHEDVDLVGDPPGFSSDDSEFTTHYDLHGVPHFNLHRIEKNKWVQQQPSVVCVLSGRAVTNQNYPIVNPAERSYWMSDYDSALNAATEWLWRRRHPPQMAEFTMNFRGLYFPPGTYFNFTHREGEADLVTEPYIVETWKVDFNKATVDIKARLHQAGAMTDPIVITAGTFDAHDSSLGTTNDFPPPSWEV